MLRMGEPPKTSKNLGVKKTLGGPPLARAGNLAPAGAWPICSAGAHTHTHTHARTSRCGSVRRPPSRATFVVVYHYSALRVVTATTLGKFPP